MISSLIKKHWIMQIHYLRICIVFAFIAGLPGFAQDYYLNSSATGANNGGSGNNAWQSLSAAMTALRALPDKGAGDRVFVYTGSGNYGVFSDNSVRTDWLTFQAADGQSPEFLRIACSDPGGTHNIYLKFDGIDIKSDATVTTGNNIVDVQGANYVYIRNASIVGYERYWDISPTVQADHFTLENCEITFTTHYYGSADPGGKCRGLNVIGSNILVSNCIVHAMSSSGIYCDTNGETGGIIIENTEVYDQIGKWPGWTAGVSPDAKHGSGIAVINGDYLTLRGNVIHGCGSSGGHVFCYTGTHDNMVIENNILYDGKGFAMQSTATLGANCKFNNNTVVTNWQSSSPSTSEQRYSRAVSIYFSNYNHTFEFKNNVIIGYMETNAVDISGESSNNIVYSYKNTLGWTDSPYLWRNTGLGANSVILNSDVPGYGWLWKDNAEAGGWNPEEDWFINPHFTPWQDNSFYTWSGVTSDFSRKTGSVLETRSSGASGTGETIFQLSTTAVNGSIAKSPDTATYTSGQTVTLTATPNTGYSFGSWTGDATGSTNPVTITINSNKSVTANFTQNTYTLAVTAVNGTVNKSPNLASYTYGQTVTLTATPYSGYTFSSWSGDMTSTSNPVTITINGNKTITATLSAITLFDCMTAHWMLDENTGSIITDTTSANRTATLINNPGWGYPWADEDWVSFTNQTQAIAIPTSTLNTQAGTIAVWIEPESSTGTQFILGHVLNSSNRIGLYSVAGKLAVGLGSAAALQTNIADLTVAQPAHIVLMWSGTTYTVYVNTEQKAAGTFSGLTGLNTTMDIGNYGNASSRTYGFIGIIDDIRTFCRALTAAEVRRLYYTEDVRQRKTVNFTMQTIDSNEQIVTFQPATILPSGATYESGVFSWQPWYNQSGYYVIGFTATGQTTRVATVSVHQTPLAEWYRQFLIYTGKLD